MGLVLGAVKGGRFGVLWKCCPLLLDQCHDGQLMLTQTSFISSLQRKERMFGVRQVLKEKTSPSVPRNLVGVSPLQLPDPFGLSIHLLAHMTPKPAGTSAFKAKLSGICHSAN